MASSALAEYQELKSNLNNLFADSSVFGDLLGEIELPTPPLSPDHADTPASNTTELDVGESIVHQMMASASELQLFEGQGIYRNSDPDINSGILLAGKALLSDCMWNSDEYEPRNSIGMYTPAPSPPPEDKEAMEDEEEEEEEGEEIASSLSLPSEHKDLKESTECISPDEILEFMNTSEKAAKEEKRRCRRMEREARKALGYRRNVLTMSNGTQRFHPQATTSESEEEIDVVTISDRPEKQVGSRKRTSSSSSISAPSSRQPSPCHLPPTKKRRGHSKRTHRLSSAGSMGSNYGDGMESDDEQRRASHNVLERKRRNDLKFSFQVLRGQIPELEDNQRAPKVTILRKAAEYIKQIREKEEDMQLRLAKEQRRESKLKQRLAYLKTLQV